MLSSMRRTHAAGLMMVGVCTAALQASTTKPSIIKPMFSRTFCAAAASASAADPSLAELRKEYSKQGIDVSEMTTDPLDTFKVWFQEARNAKCVEPNAMCLSTCKNNTPTARYVLLKAFDERGFVWYTNYESRKGEDLAENPQAAITFWWGDLERSVRIEGRVEKVSAEESDEYFNQRPRGAQIGAWTSNQSRDIASRDALAKQEKDIIARFRDTQGEKVTRPPHWGGYRLIPTRIEFWKGRESRLHDRMVYEREKDTDKWTMPRRLQP